MNSRGGGVTKVKALAFALSLGSGEEIDLSDSPLKYGIDDANLNPAQRKAVEAQEKKRKSAKIEFGQGFDKDGKPVGKELRGGTDSINNIPTPYLDAGVFTHNHPRSQTPNELGGTFSESDLKSFVSGKGHTLRASALEGTYSISKSDSFNSSGLMTYYKNALKKNEGSYNAVMGILTSLYVTKAITLDAYATQASNAFNQMLVANHNSLLAGQRQYGYFYTLEKRR